MQKYTDFDDIGPEPANLTYYLCTKIGRDLRELGS